jgi:hypothetical protein
MVDNSQGHSAYAQDALVASWMNLRPGGKQAHMHPGWFTQGSERVTQSMVFPADHPTFPNEPKGIKQVLLERGLWQDSFCMQCKKCDHNSTACCAKQVIKLQPDFKGQRSLVQEVIEEAGHLCIILLNFTVS